MSALLAVLAVAKSPQPIKKADRMPERFLHGSFRHRPAGTQVFFGGHSADGFDDPVRACLERE
jgi:hypothetical protein